MKFILKILLSIILFFVSTSFYFYFLGFYDEANMTWECSTVDEDFNRKCIRREQRELLIYLATSSAKGLALTAAYVTINIGNVVLLLKKKYKLLNKEKIV